MAPPEVVEAAVPVILVLATRAIMRALRAMVVLEAVVREVRAALLPATIT